jgi:hypothetical protein
MKMSRPDHESANLEIWRQAQIRNHALEIMASKFARDLNALMCIMVHTELLARLPQNLNDPAKLAPHLDRMGRLANNAVRLVRRLRKSCVLCPSEKNSARSDRSRSIPISAWRDAKFKVNVRRLESQPRTQSAPVSIVPSNSRVTFINRSQNCPNQGTL